MSNYVKVKNVSDAWWCNLQAAAVTPCYIIENLIGSLEFTAGKACVDVSSGDRKLKHC